MRTRTTDGLSARLNQIRRRFDRWRATRQGRSRIPAALWAAAVKAAGRYGVYGTARALGLDYYSLKKRSEVAGLHSPSEAGGKAGFIELIPPTSTGPAECLLELEDPRGAKMRIHLKGGQVPDLAALSRSFWSTEG
jgi:hypothetical protein